MNITALGEVLIDFLQVDSDGMPQYVAQPGGAPANVLCAAAKFGASCVAISKVGADRFGEQLVQTLKKHDVDTQSVVVTADYPTTLAFVHLAYDGDRSFSFYREGSADTMLTKDEVDHQLLEDTDTFHCGSNSLTTALGLETTMYALEQAKASGAIISFDPNVRINLWQKQEDIVPAIKQVLPLVDVLKVSKEELELLTGTGDVALGLLKLKETYGISLAIATLGADGVMYCYKAKVCKVAGHRVEVIDTTGAGDCFIGALLSQVETLDLPADVLQRAIILANAAAALSTTKYGAIPSLPSLQEVTDFLQR